MVIFNKFIGLLIQCIKKTVTKWVKNKKNCNPFNSLILTKYLRGVCENAHACISLFFSKLLRCLWINVDVCKSLPFGFASFYLWLVANNHSCCLHFVAIKSWDVHVLFQFLTDSYIILNYISISNKI